MKHCKRFENFLRFFGKEQHRVNIQENATLLKCCRWLNTPLNSGISFMFERLSKSCPKLCASTDQQRNRSTMYEASAYAACEALKIEKVITPDSERKRWDASRYINISQLCMLKNKQQSSAPWRRDSITRRGCCSSPSTLTSCCSTIWFVIFTSSVFQVLLF